MATRKENGGHSTKAVRPDDKRLMTKSELQCAYENLKPFLPEAILQLEKAIKAGEKWAVELWFKYYFGMPKQTVDNNTNLNINDFNLKDVIKFKE
tara:strand:- start:1129 stop:1413 length:285 start_codon:yes stop_codon:yes gene_type:complete